MNTEETPYPQNFKESREEVNPQTFALRDELIRLSAAKEIKYSEKYLKKASQSALEKIKQDHDRDQLEKFNLLLTETLISKFSGLMTQLKMVKNEEELDKELSSNKLLFNDVKSLITKISPFIPMIGLLSGGLVVTKHIWNNTNKDTQNDPKVQNDKSTNPSNNSVNTADPDNDRTNTT